jgi:hypothetical protein
MRPIIARAAVPPGAGAAAGASALARRTRGRPYPAVNCEIDGAPALFALIAPLVPGEVSSGSSRRITLSDRFAACPLRSSSAPQRNDAVVESRMGAVAWAMRQRSVFDPRSSNRTCRPNGRRVGIRIVTFEACSGFTHVTARRIAQLAQGNLFHEAPARAVARTSRSSATGSIDNSPCGIFLH